MYDKPNYGANAAMGAPQTNIFSKAVEVDIPMRTSQSTTLSARPTVCSVAEMSNELHTRLSMLEESLRTVHQRIGAEHGPEAGADPISDGGPVDFTASQIADAIRRIDNFRTIVETINARI